jgi:hypothetical protein
MALPDFLIAGVPKAGTTALQTYQEHIWRRADYEALFDPAPAGTLRGEATPFYLYDLEAHNRIRALVPDAKLIFLLRDPVDRAHSNWTHLWNAGLESEADFLAACRAEQARRAAGWADFWHYTSQGLYGRQVQHLFKIFPREQVLLLRYRELKDSPAATLDRVCEFLGVRTGVLREIPKENVNRHVVEDTKLNAVLRAMLRFGGKFGHRFPIPLRLAARGPILTVLHRKTGNRPVTTEAERAALLPLFAEDIALLEDVTGEKYDDWLAVDRHARAQ